MDDCLLGGSRKRTHEDDYEDGEDNASFGERGFTTQCDSEDESECVCTWYAVHPYKFLATKFTITSLH